ncbi:MAG: hypothetical protein GWO20_14625, partial [Candidatus Korarchaeota archaeon]|nr:hypothetical protein [Candidatus Korarchaeota archaeon]
MYFYDLSRQNVILDAQQQATFIGAQTIQVDAAGVLSKKTDILNTMARRIGEMDSDTNRNIAFVATALELLRSAGDNHAIFGYFDKKLKLTQRFAAYADKDVKNILQLEQLSHLVEKRAQALPSFASLMQLLEIPTSIMKYNWNQLAQPQLRPGKFPELGQESTVSLANRIRAASKEFSGKLRKAL